MFVGFNAAFLPMHVTGLRGMPRRIYTYPGDLGWNWLNLVTTAFSFVFAAGVLVFLVDLLRHRRRGPEAGYNPWDAPSLEWAGGFVPENFRSLPVVDSRYPLWDDKDLKARMDEGRGYLPDAPTLAREALTTAPITGEPEQILTLPGPGWTPFVAALAIAVSLTALTLKFMQVAALGGAVALGFLLYWMWTRDKAFPPGTVDAGNGLALPRYRNDDASVGWWGMVVLLIADASLTLCIGFSYLFLWTARPAVWPPDGSEVPGLLGALLVLALVAGAHALFEAAERVNRRDRRPAAAACLAGAAALAALAVRAGWGWLDGLGIDPTEHGYGAAVHATLGWSALHLVLGGVMALWCLARLALGMIDSWRCLTLRVCVLWWRFTTPVAAFALLLVAGFPHAFR
jgi:cytochrome c oxidase subunit I+III